MAIHGRACLLALFAVGTGVSVARADVFTNAGIPTAEKAGYQLVYDFNIPDTSGGWNSAAIPYTTNNSALFPTLAGQRVAYYIELLPNGGTPGVSEQYVYASFNAAGFATAGNQLGVPSNGPNGSSGGVARKVAVGSMNIFSNVAGVTTGTGITGGNVEFWPSDYGTGANGVFDYDDNGFSGSSGHGSMQIHNGGAAQTLFAYNAWGTVRDSELGLGTQVGGSNNPDWTFNTTNNDNFSVQRLQILATPEPGSVALLALGGLGMLARRRRRH